jgi:hypothetical protein
MNDRSTVADENECFDVGQIGDRDVIESFAFSISDA